ncbi:MAG: DegV family protein [Firmicutes bacterium]|nr:DegV family protein [Bacillota bacterium]
MITIVSDSSIALSKREADEMGVVIVPMNYVVDGKSYLEYYSNALDAVDKIKVGTYKTSTSQPPIEMFANCFRDLVAKKSQVLCFTISGRLSGTFSSAKIASNDIDSDNIRIVDTLSATGAIRLLVLRAKELIAKGLLLDEIYSILNAERDRLGNAFSVENMEPLKRSGRLGFVRQSVSTILNIRPLLQFKNGSLECVGFLRGKRNQGEKLLELVPNKAKQIIVQHIDNEQGANELAELVIKRFPEIESPIITSVGPVLAIHIGIPAIGLAWTL